ncbi:MAG: hypothetical protein NTV30_06370 [Chloroflexi bacterium]|nr:hypothetical protein [Chloroflexota bacterium]
MKKENTKSNNHIDIISKSEQPKEAAKPQVKMVMTKRGYLRPERSTRCSNCQERISIPLKHILATCPYCGMQFRISWVTPDQPRVRGPVWSSLPGIGPWPKGWPGELDNEGKPIKR